MSVALLRREMVRTSRRWHHYAFRLVFLGLLGGALLLTWTDVLLPNSGPAAAGMLGRALFDQLAPLMLAVVALGVPVLVAQAIQEERDARTLDLLLLTRLGAPQLLAGKVASRLGLLLTVLYGAAPLLALVVGLGGVSLAEVGNAVVGAMTLGALLALICAHAAWLYGGLLVPTVLTWTWAVIGLLFIPAWAWSTPGIALEPGYIPFSPVSSWTSDGLTGLAPVAVLLWVGAFSSAVTAATVTEQRGWQQVLAGAAALGVASFAVAPTTLRVLHLYDQQLVWAWSLVALTTFTVGWQLALYQWQLHRGHAHHREWGRWWGDVRGNPLAWQELTLWIRQPGRSLLWLGAIGVGVLLALPHASPPAWVLERGAQGFALTATLLTVLPVTRRITRERIAGTLPVLLSTTLPPHRVLAGLLAPVAVAALPMVTLAVALWARFAVRQRSDILSRGLHGDALQASPFGLNLWETSPVLKGVLTLVWAGGAWFFVLMLVAVVALRVRPARLAWPANLTLVGVALSVFALPLSLPAVAVLQGLFAPLVGPAWMYLPGTPPELLIAAAATWSVGAWMALWASLRLHRWCA